LRKALVTENIDKKADVILKQDLKLEVQRLKKVPSSKELLKLLKSKSFKVLCSRSRTQLTKEVLLKSHLDCIGAFCIGVNQIDIRAACKKGIPVFNAPYGNTRSVAELVISLIIALSRSLFSHNLNMHQGQWLKFAKGCFEIRGKNLGIVGYGNIGSQLGVLAESLGMKVFYYDIVSKLPLGNAQTCFSLKELIKQSDFISLHVPETDHTKNMIQLKELKQMKPGAYLINTSRGKVISLTDLKKALEKKYLSGVALDVFPEEPKVNHESFPSLLQGFKNVILTPHIGGSTEEAQKSILQEVSKRLKDFLTKGSIQNSVNFPNLILPALEKGTTRIANIHKNQPGVLSSINYLVSQSKVNIKSQYLATNEHIGYLVMDLEEKNIAPLAKQINQLKVSIKTHIFK